MEVMDLGTEIGADGGDKCGVVAVLGGTGGGRRTEVASGTTGGWVFANFYYKVAGDSVVTPFPPLAVGITTARWGTGLAHF